MSPITFASRNQVDEDVEDTAANDGYEEDQDDEDDDESSSTFFKEKYKYTPAPASAGSNVNLIPTSTSVTAAQYTLLAFSTGQILEDHNYLSWYSIHPHELLELHTCNYMVGLPRDAVDHYVEPYFEAKVWALRTTANPEVSEGAPRPGERFGRMSEAGDTERDKTKKRRTKLQWNERWVVIHRGLFQLCVERDVSVRVFCRVFL